jgi:hypothetical protein
VDTSLAAELTTTALRAYTLQQAVSKSYISFEAGYTSGYHSSSTWAALEHLKMEEGTLQWWCSLLYNKSAIFKLYVHATKIKMKISFRLVIRNPLQEKDILFFQEALDYFT